MSHRSFLPLMLLQRNKLQFVILEARRNESSHPRRLRSLGVCQPEVLRKKVFVYSVGCRVSRGERRRA